jgi:hypothetical protein
MPYLRARSLLLFRVIQCRSRHFLATRPRPSFSIFAGPRPSSSAGLRPSDPVEPRPSSFPSGSAPLPPFESASALAFSIEARQLFASRPALSSVQTAFSSGFPSNIPTPNGIPSGATAPSGFFSGFPSGSGFPRPSGARPVRPSGSGFPRPSGTGFPSSVPSVYESCNFSSIRSKADILLLPAA